VLDFVRGFIDEHSYPPSIPEIASGIGRTYSSVREQLERLERMGYITREPHVARSLTLTEKAGASPAHRGRRRRSDRSLYVPLVGRAPAGEPLLAGDNVEEEVLVPYMLLRRDEEGFLVRVHGDSMLPRLEDGDVVVVRAQVDAENGDIVVARCGDDESASDVCIKQLRKENGHVVLESLNPAYDSVAPAFVEIVGVVVGMMRSTR
jgi:repressor LexA